MLVEIVRHTPVWVWGLLVALLALGAAQLRARSVSPARLAALPMVLALLGLSATATSFVPPWPALAAWATALGAGAMLGLRLPRPAGAHWDAEHHLLRVPGSVVPLAIIVVVFVLRYAGAVALALHPAWRSLLAVALPLAAGYGGITGLLGGRTLGLLRLPHEAAP